MGTVQCAGADPVFWVTGLLGPLVTGLLGFKIWASETAFPAFWRHFLNEFND